MKYRKKTAVIEAIQWTGDNEGEISFFTKDEAIKTADNIITIPTDAGNMDISVSDFIIKGTDGKLYRCTNNFFNSQYEPVL